MPLLPLPEAVALVLARAAPLQEHRVPLAEASGRILAEELRAPRDLPGNDISMMDGYAVRSSDASPDAPLRVVYEVPAGAPPAAQPLGPGEAARIFTGAPIPPSADAVVMQEHVRRESDRVAVAPDHAPKAGQHIRRRGEEVRAGAVLLQKGALLGPAELSLAAASGAPTPLVFGRPRVALLATGDELVPIGAEPGPGKLVETNSVALAALVREAGGEPVMLGIAGDQPDRIAERLEAAEADVLVTTGGASVGDHDHAQDALELLSGQLVFHQVAIRPGKPVLFGTASRGRLLFGLPGNPAAAMLGFELFVRVAIRRMLGDAHPERTAVRAVLRGGGLNRLAGLTFFPRGVLRAHGSQLAFSAGAQQSSMQIGSWAGVNAVARIEPGSGRVEPGDEIDVLPLRALV